MLNPVHRHDFHELFWVEDGQGVHLVNGDQHPLEPGCLVLVRDRDCHSFGGILTIVNIAFSTQRWRSLMNAYGSDMADPMRDPDHRRRTVVLSSMEQRELTQATAGLRAGDWSALSIDYVLLHLLRLLRGKHHADSSAPQMPGWLASDHSVKCPLTANISSPPAPWPDWRDGDVHIWSEDRGSQILECPRGRAGCYGQRVSI